MKFLVEVDLDNDSMSENHNDLAKILKDLAFKAKRGDFMDMHSYSHIYDVNGNKIGKAYTE